MALWGSEAIIGDHPMPELHGQPYKDELRQEIRTLNRQLREAYSERRALRYVLMRERHRREALDQRLRELEGKLSELAAGLGEFREQPARPVEAPRLAIVA
jgi:chromosome segregation ATPase